MNEYFIEKEIKYIGSQLSPHWIYKNFNLIGDSIVSFIGEVDVNLNEMVDIEDVINNEPIYSKKMLNFIIERFDIPLNQMLCEQRLLVCLIKEELERHNIKVTREGDDLFIDNKKLTVSIATKSLTSCLIHTGINIESDGAPIDVSCLRDCKIANIKEFAQNIMHAYNNEVNDIKRALCKVRGV